MKRCAECFDIEIPAKLLAQSCRQIRAESDPTQPDKIVLVLTCKHGGTRRHSVYRNGEEWRWVTNLSRADMPMATAAA